MHSYVPVPTGAGFKCVSYSHPLGGMVWKSSMVGHPYLPLEMGGGIDWSSVWGKAKELGQKALPHIERPAVGAKLIELGMKQLGLGIGDSDDAVFDEVSAAMKARRRQRRLR